MISLIISVFIAFAAWTAFALLNKEHDTKEIKSVLSSISFDCKDLILNIRKLFVLLVKDALKSEESKDSQPIYDIPPESKDSVISETDYPAQFSALSDEDEDTTIASFSRSVIETIEEEENKAA